MEGGGVPENSYPPLHRRLLHIFPGGAYSGKVSGKSPGKVIGKS